MISKEFAAPGVTLKIRDSSLRKRYCLHQTCTNVLTDGMLLQGRSYCSTKCRRASEAIRRKVERHADVVKDLREQLRKALAAASAANKAKDKVKTRAKASIKRKSDLHAYLVKSLQEELQEAHADARAARKVSVRATKELRDFLLTCTCGAIVKDHNQS